jgi:hypothetical protein
MPSLLRSLFVCLSMSLILFCASPFPALAQGAAPTDQEKSCASAEYAAAATAPTATQGATIAPTASQAPQTQPPAQGSSQASAAASATGQDWPDPVVVPGTSPYNTTHDIEIGQQITVCVMGLRNWTYGPKKKNDPTTLRLLIAGRLLSAPPVIGPAKQEYVNFVLRLDTVNSDDWKAWADILQAARHSDLSTVPISLVAGKSEVFESKAFVKIIPYPGRWYIAGIAILFVVLLVSLLVLARKTNLLRYTPGQHPTLPLMSPYSVGLVQMAFWFYNATGAYVYIALTTHQIHIPMGSVLGLLGISSTTGLAAVYVEKIKDSTSNRKTLLAEQSALKARIADLTPAATADSNSPAAVEMTQRKARLAEVENLIDQLPAPTAPAKSEGILKDLLKDGSDYSFHRVQIFVWTILLGVVFGWSVFRNNSMPEFDASLLTLMGISSGTYVGFKFPETPKGG